MRKTPVPVTVLSGFLGAGKTTLLRHILTNEQNLRVGLLINDMGELNIDAMLVQQNGVTAVQRSETLVELSNGCICCTLREDLLIEIRKLAMNENIDYIIIESSGISEPLPVAETFTFADENGESLQDVARLDTMVTVVDALRVPEILESQESLEDERSIVQLFMDQIEFANVIILNKIDLISDEDKTSYTSFLQRINPRANIIVSDHGKIDPKEILNTEKFSLQEAEEYEQWLAEPRGSHTPETEEYGIRSWIYRARKPFHPERLAKLLENGQALTGIFRSKGFAWIANRHGLLGVWSQAGAMLYLEPGGYWLAYLHESERPRGAQEALVDAHAWQEPYGDRRQEIVFIGGENSDPAKVTEALNNALVTDEEYAQGPEAWMDFIDPLPKWE